MGRSRLKILAGWADCARCPRHGLRLGVVAQDWGRRPTVLVVGHRVHRVSQGLVAHSPRAEAFAWELAHELRLDPEEVLVDTLLACGLGHESASDHVAACSARFLENTRKYGGPKAVVVVGAHAQTASLGAGLIDGETWALVGAPASPAVRASSWAVTRSLVTSVELALGRTPRSKRLPHEDLALAGLLIGSLGWADGSASKERDAGSWKRRTSSQLTLARVAQHLRGTRYWAPFRPRGPWPFVVIDADRHDALQGLHFPETLRTLQRLFPSSFFVWSSSSAGVHVYVRLPPDTTYEEAATWLEAYFALKKKLVLEKKIPRSSSRPAVLRSTRLEVPRQPVRLPFGLGSTVINPKKRPKAGSSRAQKLTAMVAEFTDWIATADASDYDRAKGFVETHLKRTGGWSVDKRKFLELEIEAVLVADLKPATLSAADPWFAIIPELPDNTLRVIATRGVPAMGMRSRCTTRLVDALFDLVEPDQVEGLIIHWLRNRDHNSEDIETDLISVEAALKKHIEAKKQTVHGVPVRVWRAVEQGLGRASASLSTSSRPGWMLPPTVAGAIAPLLEAGSLEQLRKRHELLSRTAFFVLRGFFDHRTRKADGPDGERPVPRREFSRFLPNEMRKAVKEFFLLARWLTVSGKPEKGTSARRFKLADDLWPALPGEAVLFVPDS